jgi:hypothetical protein
MATKPVSRKLRLRLALIAALPEPILLERLQRLPRTELEAFQRRYGIRECSRKGRCQIRFLQTIWDADTGSSNQTRCVCAASRQATPPIPFSAHQQLAKLLKVTERGPYRPRRGPNRPRVLRHAA